MLAIKSYIVTKESALEKKIQFLSQRLATDAALDSKSKRSSCVCFAILLWRIA